MGIADIKQGALKNLRAAGQKISNAKKRIPKFRKTKLPEGSPSVGSAKAKGGAEAPPPSYEEAIKDMAAGSTTPPVTPPATPRSDPKKTAHLKQSASEAFDIGKYTNELHEKMPDLDKGSISEYVKLMSPMSGDSKTLIKESLDLMSHTERDIYEYAQSGNVTSEQWQEKIDKSEDELNNIYDKFKSPEFATSSPKDKADLVMTYMETHHQISMAQKYSPNVKTAEKQKAKELKEQQLAEYTDKLAEVMPDVDINYIQNNVKKMLPLSQEAEANIELQLEDMKAFAAEAKNHVDQGAYTKEVLGSMISDENEKIDEKRAAYKQAKKTSPDDKAAAIMDFLQSVHVISVAQSLQDTAQEGRSGDGQEKDTMISGDAKDALSKVLGGKEELLDKVELLAEQGNLNTLDEADKISFKKAYRKFSLKYHPDKNGHNERKTEIFREISEIYQKVFD